MTILLLHPQDNQLPKEIAKAGKCTTEIDNTHNVWATLYLRIVYIGLHDIYINPS